MQSDAQLPLYSLEVDGAVAAWTVYNIQRYSTRLQDGIIWARRWLAPFFPGARPFDFLRVGQLNCLFSKPIRLRRLA